MSHLNDRSYPIVFLEHKNVKAFITHAGLMGTQESIYCGVPMIAVPLFADQPLNADSYVKKKIAVKLDFREITTKSFTIAINEVLNNPEYK